VKIGFIAFAKLATQRGFLDEDYKQMNYYSYQQSISGKQERAKEDGFSDYHRKDSNIHRIASPLIGPLSDQEFRRVDRRWRSFSNEGERSRTPEIESYSQQEREKTNHPDGWNQKHCPSRSLKQQPGDDPGHCPRNQDRENERFQSNHELPPSMDHKNDSIAYEACRREK
jgi:hypothetical protein